MNKNCCKKMKNNLTPTPLLDKEREKLLTSEESLTNSGEVKKCGFSLAEAMVMLVIVAILMALSAPLIAKRSSADAKKLVQQNTNNTQTLYDSGNNPVAPEAGFSSIFSTINPNQNYGIGTRTPNAKLHVQGTNANADILNVTARQITPRAAGDSAEQAALKAAADTGLFVRRNGNNAEVNIVACVPDWSRISVGAPVSPFPEDGYLLVKNCATITVPPDPAKGRAAVAEILCPPIYPAEVTYKDPTYVGSDYQYVDNSSVLVPVNRDTTYTRTPAGGNIPTQDLDDPNRFIPCREGYKAYHRG